MPIFCIQENASKNIEMGQLSHVRTLLNGTSRNAFIHFLIALALFANAVTQYGAKHKIFFSRKLIQWLVAKSTDNINTNFCTKENIETFVVNRANKIGNITGFQLFHSRFAIRILQSAKSCIADSFFTFINQVRKYFQFIHRIFQRQVLDKNLATLK